MKTTKMFFKTIFHNSKILILLAVTLMMQSCFTYRSVYMNSVKADGTTYKIKQGFEQQKVKIIKIKDSSLVVESWQGQREVQKSNIDKIKIKEFNALLTVGVGVVGVVTALTAILIAALSNARYY